MLNNKENWLKEKKKTLHITDYRAHYFSQLDFSYFCHLMLYNLSFKISLKNVESTGHLAWAKFVFKVFLWQFLYVLICLL